MSTYTTATAAGDDGENVQRNTSNVNARYRQAIPGGGGALGAHTHAPNVGGQIIDLIWWRIVIDVFRILNPRDNSPREIVPVD